MTLDSNDISYYDSLLTASETDGVKIDFDLKALNQHFQEPTIGVYDNSYLSFSVTEMVNVYEMMKGLSGDDMTEFAEEHFSLGPKDNSSIINKDIYYTVLGYLPEDASKILIGTICKAVFLIARHYQEYCNREMHEEEYKDKKKSAKETIKFLEFLIGYNNEQNKVRSINISYKSENQVNSIIFPHEWWDIIIHGFEKGFNENSKTTAIEFYNEVKNNCESFVKSFSKSQVRRSKTLREYAFSLDSLLQYYKIGPANNRHIIIGQLFLLLHLIPKQISKRGFDESASVRKTDNQKYADRIKKYLERR